MRKLWSILLLSICLPVFAQDPELLSHWQYDAKAPLDTQQENLQFRDDVTIHDISFASPKGGRVPAYLVIPAGKGRFPAIVWGHWYWASSPFANRNEFLEEAVVLAKSGVASLLISGPIARPGYVQPKSPFTDEAANYLVQAVVDMLRGVDLLFARKDIDPKRIAYVGHSYNATVGGLFSGIDKRFTAFVLMAGDLSYEADLKTKMFQDLRAQMGPAKFDPIIAQYGWADPGKYVAHAAPAPVFLQYASKEDFLNPELAKQYFAIVSEPKKMKIYEAPHALNAEARRDRIAFLAEQLKFRAPSADAIARIPELPQPDK
jgi:cephalosporin-C deacetylase-like acetyl esterase